ncbi:MAG TPA: c-type cytochrome [Chitinophagales bacterium]|nr:c-type cytochrome [Chitinophagales bacterium]
MKSEHNPSRSKAFTFTTLLTVILSLGFLFANAEVDKARWTEGKSLFKSNCASCHNPKADGTGPALQGVTARWEAAGDFKGKTGKQWLSIWIHNWKDATGAGYKYAVDMANSRPSEMNIFNTLNPQQIDDIILYVENPDAGGAPKVVDGPKVEGTKGDDAGGSNTVLYMFAGLLLLLVIILVNVTNHLDKIVSDKAGEVAVAKLPFYKRTNFKAACLLIGIVVLMYFTVDTVTHFGRQQGYQPSQPIKFSHALHAGTHKIDCQYCHQTANNGKHSNIPSLNTCMNCHKQVTKGPQYGTEEIAKIYAAVGWDPTSKTYDLGKAKPVEWTRIHNLPDHVYFNHAQHVNAGKVKCQTCHGNVEQMEEVYQYSPLSMGWCINCHRNTEVQFASNNYYAAYESIHKDLKDKKIDKVTVSAVGGTECQRCHY